MRADTAKAVCAFRFKGQRLGISEQRLSAGFDFLTERVFFGTGGAVSGFGAVPTYQAEADPLGRALEFKRITIHGQDIPHWRADTATARGVAEIVRFGGKITATAGSDEKQSRKGEAKHRERWPCLNGWVNWGLRLPGLYPGSRLLLLGPPHEIPDQVRDYGLILPKIPAKAGNQGPIGVVLTHLSFVSGPLPT